MERKMEMNWITGVELSDDTWTITYTIPHAYGSHSYSESFSWGQDYPPPFVKVAASRFLEALTTAVNDRVAFTQKVPCETCTGNCCKHYETMRITRQDLRDFLDKDVDFVPMVFLWDGLEWPSNTCKLEMLAFIDTLPQSIDGTVGSLKKVPYRRDKNQTACINLQDDGCVIYEQRPAVCRNYPAIGCEIHEEDTKKTKGLVQLRAKRERDAIL